MKTRNFCAAVLVAATAGLASQALARSDASSLVPSPAVGKLLAAAQKLITAGDFRTALDQVHAAQAVPNRTADDDYIINEFVVAIAIKQNDIPAAGVAFEAMADSPDLQKDPNKVDVLTNAMVVENISKKFQKTIAYGQMLQGIQPLQGKQLIVMTEAYYFSNDYPHAKEWGEKAIAEAKAAGTPPPQDIMQMMININLKLGNRSAAETAQRDLAVNYGSAEDWGREVDLGLSTKAQPIDALNLLRLGVAAGATLDASDYRLMGEIATRLGYFGDAAVAERHGARIKGAAGKSAADQRELPSLLAAAKGQDARHNMVLAQDVYGYGRFAEAEELARRALAKGAQSDEANMVIGMSLVGEGKYSDAVATFQQVGGSAKKGADLWLGYTQHKASPAAAAAPAATTAH